MIEKFSSRDLYTQESEEKNELSIDPDEDKVIHYNISCEDFEIARVALVERKEKIIQELQEKELSPTYEQKELLHDMAFVIDEFLLEQGIVQSKIGNREINIAFISFNDFRQSISEKPEEFWDYSKDPVAVYIPHHELIVSSYLPYWDDNKHNAEFIHTLGHEFVHAKSFQNLHAYNSHVPTIDAHRSGLEILRLGGYKTLFSQLNEAITEEIAIEITNRMVNEKEGLLEPLDSDLETYQEERKILSKLIKVLAENSKEYKEDKDAIKKLFYDAYFTGSMLKIGRLIEKTFPIKRGSQNRGEPKEKGTFRLIAEDFLGKELKKRFNLV